MSTTGQQFIKAILSQPQTDEQGIISEAMLPLIETHHGTIQSKLAVMLMIFESHKGSLESKLDSVKTMFSKIIDIVEEHGLKLPEEDSLIEDVVNELSEEGEGAPASAAPTNVTAGIEPTVPRIKPRKKKEVDDGTN